MGLAVGNWFPDVDQKTDLLVHRSIVTHWPLLPLIVVVASVMRKRLSFDLLPKDWSGFALISVSGLRLDGSMVLWGLDSHQHGVLRLPGYQAGEELV